MSRSFKWREQVIPVMDLDDLTLGELVWAEKQVGASLSDWTNGQEALALVALSVRRTGEMVKVADLEDIPFSALAADLQAGEADPTPPTAEGGSTTPSEAATSSV